MVTPPVSREGFTYQNGRFWVESDTHKHPRKTAQELYDMVTITPLRELPAHFFSAQLAHYGLKVFKTREPAKKHLRQTLQGTDGGRLFPVPKHILDLEAALKKEWDGHEALRKAQMPKVGGEAPEEANGKRKRTKQTARKSGGDLYHAARSKGPRFNFDEVDSDEGTAVRKKPRTKQTARKTSTGTGKVVGSASKVAQTKPKPKLTKAQIRTKINALSLERARQLLGKVLDKVPQAESVLKAEFDESKPLALADWAGEYSVHCRSITDEWDTYTDDDFSFEIYPSSTSSHFWVSFNFGMLSGVMRSIGGLPSFDGEKIFVEWRGRDGDENTESTMTFSERNRGVLTFLSDGQLHGNLHGDFYGGKLSFTASLERSVGKAGVPKQTLKGWKSEFRNYNGNNYEVENVSRWGKWGGEEKEDKPYESDTSVGHEKRRVKMNFDSFGSNGEGEGSEDGHDDDEDSEGEGFWGVNEAY